jgi:hypothetical protein
MRSIVSPSPKARSGFSPVETNIGVIANRGHPLNRVPNIRRAAASKPPFMECGGLATAFRIPITPINYVFHRLTTFQGNTRYPSIPIKPNVESGGHMTLKTSGLGLIVLGILLLGAQLVLYLGFKNVYPPPGTGEQHIGPPPSARTTPLPGVFGAISIIAGIAFVAKRPEQADDPRDGLTIPENPADRAKQEHS